MRRVRYQVACSLDGFIAGPSDDFDWIPPEPAFDFDALYAQFDTLLMGRRTYEVVRASVGSFRGKEIIVAPQTLLPGDHPDVEVVGTGLEARFREPGSDPGGDIWLYGRVGDHPPFLFTHVDGLGGLRRALAFKAGGEVERAPQRGARGLSAGSKSSAPSPTNTAASPCVDRVQLTPAIRSALHGFVELERSYRVIPLSPD